MKKDNSKKSNIFPVAAVSLLCLGILAGVFLSSKEHQTSFAPEATTATTENSTWREPETRPAAASILKETESQIADLQSGTPDDEVQVIESAGNEVEITLTPPVTKPAKENAPKETASMKSCPDKAPTSMPETSPVPSVQEAEPQNTSPVAESQGHEGQVYDPVFGWITPGAAQADVIDNDGDVNKQIGYIE